MALNGKTEMQIGFLKNKFTRRLAAEYFKLKKNIPRSLLAMRYLRGSGLEIGALHNPIYIGLLANVRYVDRMKVHDLISEYPELSSLKLVAPDIVDNGEELATVPAESIDFIVANHFIEHCEDPIQTIKNFAQKISAGGYIYMAVPDKRFTFDINRSSTAYQHLANDHKMGPNHSRESHYREWVQHFHAEAEQDLKTKELLKARYSIHFHVWTKDEFLNFLLQAIAEFNLPLVVVRTMSIGDETVFLLRKVAQERG